MEQIYLIAPEEPRDSNLFQGRAMMGDAIWRWNSCYTSLNSSPTKSSKHRCLYNWVFL